MTPLLLLKILPRNIDTTSYNISDPINTNINCSIDTTITNSCSETNRPTISYKNSEPTIHTTTSATSCTSITSCTSATSDPLKSGGPNQPPGCTYLLVGTTLQVLPAPCCCVLFGGSGLICSRS